MRKCDICWGNGELNVLDRDVPVPLKVCDDCLNDFAHQDYDRLRDKLENRKKSPELLKSIKEQREL